jgi:predicted lipoprotein with Yx(FWY)xxD motif
MHRTRTSTAPPGTVRRARAMGLAAAALCVGLLIPVAAAGASTSPAATHRATGLEISAVVGPYGAQLVVGSGPLKGFSIYGITSDTATTFGCTPTLDTLGPGGSISCTGSTNDQNAEWPAITTNAAPVAGPGVTQSLLGSVYRKGIGHQVTYAGHPLYGFDTSPGQVTGEGYDEPSLPPWHGQWWLVAPSGQWLVWSQTLTATAIVNGTTVLSAQLLTLAGWHDFPLYSFSADTSSSSACGASCSLEFDPLLTSGRPGVSGTSANGTIGTITRADGSTQITYDGKPLYLYSDEGILRRSDGSAIATGSGNGKVVGGGTFTLVGP